jgi:hypothetical protein
VVWDEVAFVRAETSRGQTAEGINRNVLAEDIPLPIPLEKVNQGFYVRKLA